MSKKEQSLLIFWLLANLIVGLLIVHAYGISYDEPDYYLYAQNTVDAYRSFFGLAYTPDFGPHDLPNYGPAFIIFPELTLRLFKPMFQGLFEVDLWHYSYFLLFQLGGLCLFSLARRWFEMWSAWGLLALYTFQPLLWGHAFINPKDIPFMVFFLFTIWSGFRLADSLGATAPMLSLKPGKEPDGDSRKAKLILPRFVLKESFPFLRQRQVILAGILLGMTMSIRLLGPWAGLIVILYLAFTLDRKSVPVIGAYVMWALLAMFLTWPYLWTDPIGHWMDSLVLMTRFPWPGRVLFGGQFYDPDKLPMSYLPTLLNIQLTEPLLILIYLGLALLIVSIFRKGLRIDLLLIIFLGAIFPLTALILTRATMYDNFRQLLFLLPPLLLLAGPALDLIFSIMKSVGLRIVVLLLLVLPGMYAIVRLHPYQYVYYNALVGGTGGAFRNYEMDYWFTSFHEAAHWLNQNAPANSTVESEGNDFLLPRYLRTDLKLSSEPGRPFDFFVTASRYNKDLTSHPDAAVIYSIARDGAILAVIKGP